MIDITKLQKLISATPAIVPMIKALPERLDELGKARDAIMKAASPATAALVGRFASKSTPFAVHAAIFGGGFVAGAVSAALFTPMRGDELRGVIKGEANNLWDKWSGKAEDVVDDASDVAGEARETVAEAAEQAKDRAAEAAGEAKGRVVQMRNELDPSRSALDDLTKDELYERAREADIPGRSEMDKQQLVDALRTHLN